MRQLSGGLRAHARKLQKRRFHARRVEEGSADKSYGIEVARLAGLPPAVIARAREVLSRHEQSERQLSEELTPGLPPMNGSGEQQALFTPIDREVLDALRAAIAEEAPPVDAAALTGASRLNETDGFNKARAAACDSARVNGLTATGGAGTCPSQLTVTEVSNPTSTCPITPCLDVSATQPMPTSFMRLGVLIGCTSCTDIVVGAASEAICFAAPGPG